MKVLQVVGYKNAGKTTLVCDIVKAFSIKGYRVGTIKHDAHTFEPDPPGTDTWQHRQAGALATAITSPTRTAWSVEQSQTLDELLADMRERAMDFIVVEGFKAADYPKIVLLQGPGDEQLLALSHITFTVRAREYNLSELLDQLFGWYNQD